MTSKTRSLAILIATCAVTGICIASLTLPRKMPWMFTLIVVLNVCMFGLAFKISKEASQ